MELQDRRRIYDKVLRGLDIHLGVGDKMLIDELMRENNSAKLGDISYLLTIHLINFGYESKALKEKYEYGKQQDKDFTFVFESYTED